MTAFPLVRFAAAVLLLGSVSLADAPAAKPAVEKDQATLDKEFAAKLTNVKLVGSFTMGEGEPRKDSYTILRAARGEGDEWVITAKIEYKGLALPLEMKLPVKWAGDTPVISLTNKVIPGFGTFTARVMFYGDEYAGTWSGGNHGGLMWGKIVKIADEPAKTK
ncbi:hypothetical protein [Humisphaera borealis]|uniref:Uncharacterized protein n=1 Tax=Humisphaera borealis TaxID=2807512 RepID=A0A7M2WVJ1_9BACT|nr:hypothetical protein [Humisphaera borealis]QOV88500.1 hypothetical protein IPV69_19975 [Humisphaera borealis]